MHLCCKKVGTVAEQFKGGVSVAKVIDMVAVQNPLALFLYKFNLSFSIFQSNYNHAALFHH